MERKITLTVKGQKITLNRFASEVLVNVTLGFLRTLRGVETNGEIEIHIDSAQKEDV